MKSQASTSDLTKTNLEIPIEPFEFVTLSPGRKFSAYKFSNLNTNPISSDDSTVNNFVKISITEPETRRSSSALSDQNLKVTSNLHPSSSFCFAKPIHSSFLGIPTNDTLLQSNAPSSFYNRSELLHRFSCAQPNDLNEFDQKYAEATAKAVLVASARQSRTALTDVPVDFFSHLPDCSIKDTKLNSLSVQQLTSKILMNEQLKKVNILNLPGTRIPEKEHQDRMRKFSNLYLRSFDDSLNTTTHNKCMGQQLQASVQNLTNSQQMIRQPSANLTNNNNSASNIDNYNNTSKHNEKSFFRQKSHNIQKPFKRFAASLRLKKTNNPLTVHRINSQHLGLNTIQNTFGEDDILRRNAFGALTRTVILQTDQDFMHEMSKDKGLFKGYLLTDNSADKQKGSDYMSATDSDSLLSNENDRPSSAFHLKEQFFAFFQPTRNKLAMKLFGTKMALDRERLRQEQQGKWIIHPCSNFRLN